MGNSTDNDERYFLSNYGNWVDIAAPGVNVNSTVPNNKYDELTGTSQSAPLVSGAAAMILARHPRWNANDVRARLIATGKPLPSSLGIGSVRLDLFEALFNGSFEDNIYSSRHLRGGNNNNWVSKQSNTSQKERLGNILAYDRKKMIQVSTGNTGVMVEAQLVREFVVPANVTSFNIEFDYNFISEEYPEFVDQGYNDTLRILLQNFNPGHPEEIVSSINLAQESIDDANFVLWTNNPPNFPGGDNTVGQTGKRTVCRSIDTGIFGGRNFEGIWLRFLVTIEDRGDGIYDSLVLLDSVKFPKQCSN